MNKFVNAIGIKSILNEIYSIKYCLCFAEELNIFLADFIVSKEIYFVSFSNFV